MKRLGKDGGVEEVIPENDLIVSWVLLLLLLLLVYGVAVGFCCRCCY